MTYRDVLISAENLRNQSGLGKRGVAATAVGAWAKRSGGVWGGVDELPQTREGEVRR